MKGTFKNITQFAVRYCLILGFLPALAQQSSVLSTGEWIELSISETAVYKLDYNYIRNVSGSSSYPDFSKIAIFGNGGGMLPESNAANYPFDLKENAIFRYDANGNGKMEEADFILFYAEGADMPVFQSNLLTHEKNIYASNNYYYLTITEGTGKSPAVQSSVSGVNYVVEQGDEVVWNESDEENPGFSGQQWLGNKLTNFNNTIGFTLSLPGLASGAPAIIRSAVAHRSTYPSTFSVRVQGADLFSHLLSPTVESQYGAYYNYNSQQQSFSPNSSSIAVQYNMTNFDPNNNAAGWIDYVEVVYKRNLALQGLSYLPFRSTASVFPGRVSQFRLTGADPAVQVWEVGTPWNVQRIEGQLNQSTYEFSLPTDNLRWFVAVQPFGTFPQPAAASPIARQNIHGIGQPELVIVTPDDFQSAAERLANFHRNESGISSAVVPLSQLYREFSSGKQDVSAIRNLLRMLRMRAASESEKPRYLCLFGSGSFDYQNRVSGSNNWVPTYQSRESQAPLSTFNTDDFFGLLDDTEGDVLSSSGTLDVAIGRLPVQSLQEAEDIVDKIIRYKTQPLTDTCKTVNQNNSWRTQLLFIADDEDGAVHLSNSELLAEFVRLNKQKYNIDKIYMDSYAQVNTAAGNRYPDATNALLNKFNSGALVMNYVGHGSIQRWAHEVLLDQSMINQLDNADKMPLLVTATCEFSRFDLPERTGGELFLVNKRGGAIGLITTTRVVYSSENKEMNNALFDNLFTEENGRNYTLGELMSRSKNEILTQSGMVNNRKFVLLGDPALTLNYPESNVVTTAINGVPLDQPHDTIKALSVVTISGEIQDDAGQLLTDFNGVIYPTVYDKITTQQSLGNDAGLSKSFKLYRNILFKGSATVENGRFSFTFKVPQDINYAIGEGRISYYAEDGLRDACGADQTGIYVGGSSEVFDPDSVGPEVKLYMGTEDFRDGGVTDLNPLLLVKLWDDQGINTTGNSVGHDLSLWVDDIPDPVVLNDFYQTALNDYQRGSVRYLLNNLQPGVHTVRVKAWDIYNNSGEAELRFLAVEGGVFEVRNLYNYPNPFSTGTRLSFETNRCCTQFSIRAEIYDMMGRMVQKIEESRFNETYRPDDLYWDGSTTGGGSVAPGQYLYRLIITDEEGRQAIQVSKLLKQ